MSLQFSNIENTKEVVLVVLIDRRYEKKQEYALPEGVKKFSTGRERPRSVFELNREQEAPKNVSRRSCDAKNETAFS